MSVLALFLTLIGTGLLMLSLPVTWKIYQLTHQSKASWRLLFCLILLFIAGYVGYAWLLIVSELSPVGLFASAILFFGSIFVFLVTRLTLEAVREANTISELEHHNTYHDNLTGLPNRKFLFERMKQEIELSQTSNTKFAIVVIDLDDFKSINDTLGHFIGDNLLKQVAQRLQRLPNKDHLLARLGGDEFSLILTNGGADQAVVIVQHLAETMRVPFELSGNQYRIKFSAGISVYPAHGGNYETLLRCADVAMYNAKNSQSHYTVYSGDQDSHSVEQLQMMAKLNDAIERHTFHVNYQPIVNANTSEFYGVEALARWEDDDGINITPGVFILLAEQMGTVKKITQIILRQAFKQHCEWKKQGIEMKLHANLSMDDIQDPKLPKQIKTLIAETGVSPSDIVFEITESGMMTDAVIAHSVVSALHKIGVSLAIDDFGTGYSSLNYLRQLPITEIKIDQSFIRNIETSEFDDNIVRSTVDLAHSLQCKVVAEGVETEAQREKLAAMGCDLIQGFSIARPMSADRLPDWINNIDLDSLTRF